jgi:hypothetical protein
MGLWEMVVLVVFITSVANVVKAVVQPGSGRLGVSEARLQEALRQVREEMAQLRRESHEVVLSFDATLQRLDTRVQGLERQALGSGGQREALPSVEVSNRAR